MAAAIMLVYDATDMESFHQMADYKAAIDRSNPNCPILLVGISANRSRIVEVS